MNEAYVSSCLFTRLAARSVGNIRTASIAYPTCGRQAVRLSLRLCESEGHSHEDQLCERRPCSRIGRFADRFEHPGYDATAQGQFVALGERAESDGRQIWLGTRLWRIFGFRVRNTRSMHLYLGTGRTPSKKRFYGRIETICETAQLAMATGLKPLKRFQSVATLACTPLKRGVIENARTEFIAIRETAV